MTNSYGREVVLGVGGGISAYKSCELLRRLRDHNFHVTVVPTRASLNFIGSATWEALSGRQVPGDLWNRVHEVPHISLAKKADAVIIAPTTADLLAKIAHGLADDLLTNIVLANTAPLILVPAMHTEMWLNVAVQDNVKILRSRGVLVIEPDSGRLTGNDSGVGRYPEVNRIILESSEFLGRKFDLLGKRVLISAGGTREPIDSVRYIANHSSGKQALALAQVAASRGATVTVVAADVDSTVAQAFEKFDVTHVGTALEMQAALEQEFTDSDVLFMTAAVADAKPSEVIRGKFEKARLSEIKLTPNPDILEGLGAVKAAHQVICAFAAQGSSDPSSDLKAAHEKLRTKRANLLYLNNVVESAIFGSDETEGVLIDESGDELTFPRASKMTLAEILLDRALNKLG